MASKAPARSVSDAADLRPAPRKDHGMEYVGRSVKGGESTEQRRKRLDKWANGRSK